LPAISRNYHLATSQKLAKDKALENYKMYNGIPHYFTDEITNSEREFFYYYTNSHSSYDDSNFVYYSNFINVHKYHTETHVLFGNGHTISEFIDEADVNNEQPVESVNDIVSRRKRAVLPEESHPDRPKEKSRLMVPSADFRTKFLVNNTKHLSSLDAYDLPLKLSIRYARESESPASVKLTQLCLNNGEVSHAEAFEDGILKEHVSFAHRSNVELLVQTINFSRSEFRKKFPSPETFQLVSNADWLVNANEIVESQFTETRENYRLFSGILGGMNRKIGIVVIQEMPRPFVKLESDDTKKSIERDNK